MLRLFLTSIHVSHFSSPALSLLCTSTDPNFLFSVYLTPNPCLPPLRLSNFCFLFFCPCTPKLRTVFCPYTTPLQKCFAASLMLSFPLASAFFFLFSENSVLPHCNYPFLSTGVSDFYCLQGRKNFSHFSWCAECQNATHSQWQEVQGSPCQSFQFQERAHNCAVQLWQKACKGRGYV